MWVGRATVFMAGLAVILALVLGVATTALGANGKPFVLGKSNVAEAVSTLVRRRPGPALRLEVGEGQPPTKVGSNARVNDLNADLVDGLSAKDLGGSRDPPVPSESKGPWGLRDPRGSKGQREHRASGGFRGSRRAGTAGGPRSEQRLHRRAERRRDRHVARYRSEPGASGGQPANTAKAWRWSAAVAARPT